MRNFFFLLTIASSISSIAQNYKPLLDDYNEWQVTNCNNGCLTDMYYTASDTVVGGKEYKILDGFHFISRTFLLREELAAKKVYLNLIQRSGDVEYLLYDFSLSVGDSIDIKNPISPFPTDAGFFKVDSIVNRPLVDQNEYRHFYLSPTSSNTISSNPAVWIEGVGSLSLINAPGGEPDLNGVGILTCFFKNGELFYSEREDCEALVLSNDIIHSSLEGITLNTIITNDYCQMYHTKNLQFVHIFDLNGRKLSETLINGQNRVQLDFSGFSTGMYLVVAHSSSSEKKVFKVFVK